MEETTSQKTNKISAKRILRMISFVIIGITIAAFWLFMYMVISDDEPYDDTYNTSTENTDQFAAAGCNVAGIDLHGDLSTYTADTNNSDALASASSEDIIFTIQSANELNNIKAILLDIDSYGGGVVAAEEVANAIKQTEKPTVALIRESGTSAAYWAATGADIIFASEFSDVGGIGVTASYIDYAKYNEKEGYTYNDLRTAPFKDYGNPEKTLTEEEKQLIMRDLQVIHEAFVRAVAENRGLKIEQVKKLADGSSMLGKVALENKLIDRIGSYAEVKKYLNEKIGEHPTICW